MIENNPQPGEYYLRLVVAGEVLGYVWIYPPDLPEDQESDIKVVLCKGEKELGTLPVVAMPDFDVETC